MGDVADILGTGKRHKPGDGIGRAPSAGSGGGRAAKGGKGGKGRKRKPKGLKREVLNLLGDNTFVTAAPTVKPGSLSAMRGRVGKRPVTKWAWRPFHSHARRDNVTFNHWVRAAAEFPDYPFSKFNKRIDTIRYTDEEYKACLTATPNPPPSDQDARWPRDHTDMLFDLCRRYDLRWPIIADRFTLRPPHGVEDMKLRFYTVMARIIKHRTRVGQPVQSHYTKFSYKPDNDLRRRRDLDEAFRKHADWVREEKSLMDELALIDRRLQDVHEAAGDGENPISAALAGAMRAQPPAEVDEAAEAAVAEEARGQVAAAVAEAGAGQGAAATVASATASLVSAAPRGSARERALVQAQLDALPASQGGPRGGIKQRAAKAAMLDPFSNPVALRSEQMLALPDGLQAESKTAMRVMELLGALAVPQAQRLFPCGATLGALTALRRACVSLFQLQRLVQQEERHVAENLTRRQQMAKLGLHQAEPAMPASRSSASARTAQQRARSHAVGAVQGMAAAAAAAGGGGQSAGQKRGRLTASQQAAYQQQQVQQAQAAAASAKRRRGGK